MQAQKYKHEQLTAALRAMGEALRPGDRFPSQNELMRRFNVSDRTVLRSLDDLRRCGEYAHVLIRISCQQEWLHFS